MIEITRDSVIQRYQWTEVADALKTFSRWYDQGLVTEPELKALVVELALQMPEDSWSAD